MLFLCSGNYYRSRFAEYFFNHHATKDELQWSADSRGIVVGRHNNPGPISRHAVERLDELGISINGSLRYPQRLTEADLSAADLVIAVKKAEHREMLNELFPDWTDRIEYWHIDDLDYADPQEALPVLENELRALMERLSRSPP